MSTPRSNNPNNPIISKQSVEEKTKVRQQQIVNEAYTTEESFIDNINLFCEQMNMIKNIIKSDATKAKLEEYINPYRAIAMLGYEPFSKQKNGYERILNLENDITYRVKLALIAQVSKDQEAFSAFLIKVGALKEIANNDNANKIFKGQVPGKNGVNLPSPVSVTIQPVQRIPRYVLLFTDLQRTSSAEEAATLGKVIDYTKNRATYVNEVVRSNENYREIIFPLLSDLQSAAVTADPHQKIALEMLIDRIQRPESDLATIRGFLEVAKANPDLESFKKILKKHIKNIAPTYPSLPSDLMNLKPVQTELTFVRNVMYNQLYTREDAFKKMRNELVKAVSKIDDKNNGILAAAIKSFIASPQELNAFQAKIESILPGQKEKKVKIMHEVELYLDKRKFVAQKQMANLSNIINAAEQKANNPQLDFKKLKTDIEDIYLRQQGSPEERKQQAYTKIGEFTFKACALRPTGYNAAKEMFNNARDILGRDESHGQSIFKNMTDVLIHEFLVEGIGKSNQTVRVNIMDELDRRHGAPAWKKFIEELVIQQENHPSVQSIKNEFKNDAQSEALNTKIMNFIKWIVKQKPIQLPPISTAGNNLHVEVPTTPISNKGRSISVQSEAVSPSHGSITPSSMSFDLSRSRESSFYTSNSSEASASTTPSSRSSVSSEGNSYSTTRTFSDSRSTGRSISPSLNSISNSLSSRPPIPEPHKMDTDIVKAVSKLLDELRKYGNSFSSDLSKKVLSKDARALAVKRVVALNAVISEIKKSIEPGNDARDIRAVVAKAKDNKDIKDIKTSTKMPWPAPSLEEIISKHEEKIVKMLPVVDQLRSVKKQK
jgi:hypothetical protein